ncbi:zinc finger protein 541-like [Sceloporus undulatus]|uniref:zinc finger protein 541-like n=1 Tax=Sceloporus undulatus TaxID=8520 RepID=UPI001C4B0A67|nr:zinc finger protein 541-like [Sceloporus undulatus]XP_042299507.1 zinc finger protein 541-like [Sceloporus undulatus]XP_042299508.1 zinc finger protein 541-like [Sceloporus undulatus]XP_042299509.1 zinc finger protein 541-like [Sceloporus undulatus]XP_042299596.1 zinc finger protein 541-like [Sceloporus undulatus]XP_042299597.1 zinc finger protein 541-like [Sceloporus undulatus]XP_042299598.1 zinc finger protein 541-like [Sceloporus undulatus]XP_042299599.1 zinc finger protein 541-like [S
MDQYPCDDGSLQSEMQLHEFSGNQALDCNDTFSHDLCPDMRDMIYSGLNNVDVDPSLSATNINNDSLEDNLDSLSLYSVKDCDSTKLLDDCDTDSRPLLHELGLPAPSAPKEAEQGGRSSSGNGKKGKNQQSSPQAPFLDCSLCGKVFSSTSSLSKHYVTHSQERKHVCKICSKAFKRQDHLSGHMLTHQKTKPFMCIEQGCNKSYSDHRSLRRHYEMHHGLKLLKDDDASEGAPSPHESRIQMGSNNTRTAERLAVHPEPQAPNDFLLANRDLLRCIVSNFVGQKFPPASSPSVGQNEPNSRRSLQACTSLCGQISCVPTSSAMLMETTGDTEMKELYSCQKNTTSSSFYTIINPGNVSVLGPAENTNLPDRQPHSDPPFPLEATPMEYWSNSGIPHFPLFRGQKIPATSHQSSGSFQWVRNVPPACTKSKGSGVYVAQMSSASGQDISQGVGGTSPAFDSLSHNIDHPDVLSFSPLLKTQGEISGEPKLSGFEETFRSGTRFPDAPQQGVLQKSETGPVFRQLFMKSQESSVNQDKLQVQSHLFQRITKSQHIVSHTQISAPSQLVVGETEQVVAKPHQSMLQQQQTDLLHSVTEPTEREQSPIHAKKALAQFQKDFPSESEKEGQHSATVLQPFQPFSVQPVNSDSISHAKQARTLKAGCLGFKDFSNPSQSLMYESTPGNHTYGKLSQLENGSPGSRKKEKSKASTKESGGKGHSRCGRPRRKEKPKFDVSSVASPSQVAMASFSLPSTSFDNGARGKAKLPIFNRIQGGNIYSYTNAVREEHFSPGCGKTEGDPGDKSEHGSNFVCTTCSQLFYTERGLNSHMCFYSEQWRPPPMKENQQACEAENLQAQKLSFKAAGDGDTTSEIKRPSEDVAVAPFVIPVSVPVTTTNRQQEDKADEKESQDEKDFQEGMPPKKKKRRTCPKSLFIPPPPLVCSEIQPGTGGCYQSNLRSPVFLMDHLLQGLVQCSPYTPPPMLSPIREGSGLYFNTLCSSSANTATTNAYSSVLNGVDGALLFSLVKDTTKISIEPHINIGSRFQAEIPDLQDRSSMENYEHPASLVWKPWGDITTNKETQKRVTDLLKLACSSAMPGGGTNIELAVHCLHEAQGNILEALEMLLLQGPQKSPFHPLANYHYSGSHLWTTTEKQLFKKAFGLHKKDFYLIQKKIQTKTVSQCVEYYYSWKKILKFDCSRTQVVEKRKREQDEVEMDEEKIMCSPKKKQCHLPKQENKLKPRTYKKAAQSTFSPTCSQKDILDRPRSTDSQGVFPCKECARVFEKIKSRNAHMKRHRLQEQMEPMIKIKWPTKHLKHEPKKEERNPDISFLQW